MSINPSNLPKHNNSIETKVAETRVVSINTDGILKQIAPGDESRAKGILDEYAEAIGGEFEYDKYIEYRQTSINDFIAVVENEDGTREIKGKGRLNPNPGLDADPHHLVIQKSIAEYLRDRTPVRDYIEAAARNNELLDFCDFANGGSTKVLVDGVNVGSLIRVYKSKLAPEDMEVLTKAATEKAPEQRIMVGWRPIREVENAPLPEDLDIDWYINEAEHIIFDTSMPFEPKVGRLARRLEGLGLLLRAAGAGANGITTRARAKKPFPRCWNGVQAIEVQIGGKDRDLIDLPASGPTESLVLRYGESADNARELHRKSVLINAGHTNKTLSELGGITTGYVRVFDRLTSLNILDYGPLAATINEAPEGLAEAVADDVAEASSDDRSETPPEAQKGPSGAISQESGPQPQNNGEFLHGVFGDAVGVFVCNLKSEDDSDWSGGPIQYNPGVAEGTGANYFSISTIAPGKDGALRRSNPEALYVLMFDDIGSGEGSKATKTPLDRGLGDPSYIVETSPGNQQWGYILDAPVTDMDLARGLVEAAVLKVGSDEGAKDVARLARLPFGYNLKSKYVGADGSHPATKLLQWAPERRYSLKSFVEWLGSTEEELSARGFKKDTLPAAAPTVAVDHPVIKALSEVGLLRSSAPKQNGYWDIECFNKDEHSNNDDLAGVAIYNDGGWNAKCFHEHCQHGAFTIEETDRSTGEIIEKSGLSYATGLRIHMREVYDVVLPPYEGEIIPELPPGIDDGDGDCEVIESFSEANRHGADDDVCGPVGNDGLFGLEPTDTSEEAQNRVRPSELGDFNIPTNMMDIKGALGALLANGYNRAYRKAEMLSMGAAFTAMSIIAENRYVVLHHNDAGQARHTPLNPYFVMAAVSGAGKNDPLAYPGNIAKEFDCRVCTEKTKSGPAIRQTFDVAKEKWGGAHGGAAIYFDEFAQFMNSRSANPHAATTITMLTECYGAGLMRMGAMGAAAKGDRLEALDFAPLRLFAATQPKTLGGAIGGEDFNTGFVARILLLPQPPISVKQQRTAPPKPGGSDKELEAALRPIRAAVEECRSTISSRLGSRGKPLLTIRGQKFIPVRLTPEAQKEATRIDMVTLLKSSDPDEALFYNRANFNTLILAGLIAIGDSDPEAPIVTREHVDCAWRFVQLSIATWKRIYGRYAHTDMEHESKIKRAISILKGAKGYKMLVSKFKDAIGGKMKDRNELFQELADRGVVRITKPDEAEKRGRGRPATYIVLLKEHR